MRGWVFIGLMVSACAWALEPSERFSRLTMDHGLPQDSILDILQDRTGFLWLATQDGLARYDGQDVLVYRPVPGDPNSLSDNFTTTLLEDHDGIIWVGTLNGGLNRFDPRSLQVESYRHNPQSVASLPSDEVDSLALAPDGRLYIGTDRGLAVREPTGAIRRVELPLDPGTIFHLLVHSEGSVWLGTSQAGILVLDETEQVQHQYLSVRRVGIRAMMEAADGAIWVSTSTGLARVTHDYTEWIPGPDGLLIGSITQTRAGLMEDWEGRIWAGTDFGLVRFNRARNEFHTLRHDPGNPESIPLGNVTRIQLDSTGNLLVGTWAGGVGRTDLSGGVLKSLTHSVFRDARIRWVEQSPDQVVWFAAGDGMYYLDPDQQRVIRAGVEPLGSLSVRAFDFSPDGTMWLAANPDQLVRFQDGQTVSVRLSEQFPAHNINQVTALMWESEVLWVGTDIGVVHFDPTRQRADLVHPGNEIFTMARDRQGAHWFGADGLLRYQSGRWTRFSHQPDNPKSISHNHIAGIHQDRYGTLWVATSRGLNRLRRSKDGQIEFDRFTRANGFESDAFGGILEDQDGQLWLSSMRGIARFDPVSLEIRNFGRAQGALRGSYYIGSQLAAADGTFYFGGLNGVTYFRPDAVVDDQQVPPLVFTRMLIDGYEQSGPPLTYRDHVDLAAGIEEIAIEFAAIEFGAPQLIQYAYQLEGYHSERIVTDADHRRVTLTNLAPGDYQLRVWATNVAGVWDEQGIRLGLGVATPWWDTAWARFAYAALAGLAVFGFVRWRTHRLRALTHWLESEVDSRTVELQQAYDSVHTLSEIGEEISSTLDLDKILNSLYEHVRALMPADQFAIGLYDPERQVIHYELAIELGKRYQPFQRSMDEKDQLSVWCLENMQPVLINNVGEDLEGYVQTSEDDHAKRWTGEELKLENGEPVKMSAAVVYVPLVSKDRPLGVMAVNSLTPNAYEPRHLDLLQSLAGYAASAIENARALEEVTRNEEELRALTQFVAVVNRELEPMDVLESLLTQAMNLLPKAEKGLALSHMKASNDFRVVSAVGWDLEEFQPLRLDSKTAINYYLSHSHWMAHGIYLDRRIDEKRDQPDPFPTPRSRLIMALTARHELAAFVVFDSYSDDDAFDAQDIARMARVRDHALSAMDKAELLSQTVSQQRQLAQSERMASLGVLTAGVAHEINNPTNFALAGSQNLQFKLQAFQRFLHRLAGEDADPEVIQAIDGKIEELDGQLGVVMEGNQRIKSIVDDLRTFSRVEEVDRRMVDIESVLFSSLRLAQTRYKRGIDFVTQLDATPEIECDPGRLNQVLLNLMVNACQAIEERTAYDADLQGRVIVITRVRGGFLEISVEDNGAGMSEATRERIFEPFFTTKPVGSGTGLGLSISFSAVEELGGEIRVETELGRGSTFIVRLPLPDANGSSSGNHSP